jgi:hypothetical protein
VQPLYGFAVVSDATHSYLFGNSYDQDLEREGGFAATHSATSNYLARVPLGGLDQAPEYWDGTTWSPERAGAVPVSQRFQIENPLQPQRLDGRWLATTKVEGFYGDMVRLDVAADPQGPWIEAGSVTAPSRTTQDAVATYHAYPLPWLGPAGELLVIVSQNAADAIRAPASQAAVYRPLVIALERPPVVPDGGQSP